MARYIFIKDTIVLSIIYVIALRKVVFSLGSRNQKALWHGFALSGHLGPLGRFSVRNTLKIR